MKLSDVLWNAANEFLWDGAGSVFAPVGGINIYSCCAAQEACYGTDASVDEVEQFLKSLGCPIGSERAFSRSYYKSVSGIFQGHRYAWLMFASMYAEELGN